MLKIQLFDEKFKHNKAKYFFQCLLATFTVIAVLFFFDILKEAALITALGASAFIIFTMPKMYSSDPRRLIGGYIIGLLTGLIFYFLSNIDFIKNLVNEETIFLVILAGLSVGFSIFLMSITNCEHAPAAGIALGLVISNWDNITLIYIIVAVCWMAGLKWVLKPYLINLTSP